MLTNEKVMEVFSEYLSVETSCEVVMTKHGYAVLDWDESALDYTSVQFCRKPEDLRNMLLARYAEYQEFLATNGYKRELTDLEEQAIKEKRQAMLERCQEAEKNKN